MPKYRIVYDRKACIGAATCQHFDSNNFELDDDNLAVLKEARDAGEQEYEKIIDETELGDAISAADGCPTDAILIENLNTGEIMAPATAQEQEE